MAIQTFVPQDEHIELIENALGRLITTSLPIADRTRASAELENLYYSLAYEVYSIDPSLIVDTEFLQAAEFYGFRYFLLDDDEPYAAVDLRFDNNTHSVQFSNISYGPFIDDFVNGVDFIESRVDIQTQDYKARILEIPGIYVRALWLQPVKEVELDVLVPLRIGQMRIVDNFTRSPSGLFNQLLDEGLLPLDFNSGDFPPIPYNEEK